MQLTNSYRKIERIDVDQISNELEVNLPEEYVRFLLDNNGGQPVDGHFLKKGSRWGRDI